MEARTCKTCRYWVELRPEAGSPTPGGYCHRMPPTALGFATWPITRPADWCGEWVMFKGKAK